MKHWIGWELGKNVALIADLAPPNQAWRGVASAKKSCGIFPQKEMNV
jgi:hypothetical protein